MTYQLSQYSLGALSSHLNLDAGETPNFKREFEYVSTEVYKKKYATGKALQLFPVASGIPAMAKNYVFKTGDRVGRARFVAEGSLDIPMSELTGDEVTQNIKPIKTGFQYTVEDLARVGSSKFNIPSQKAEGAVQDIFNLHNTAFWLGDTANGITGILNNPNIVGAAVAAGVGGVTWALKTPDEVLKDLSDAVNTMRNGTLMLEQPTLLVMSSTAYTRISTTKFNNDTLMTILQVFNMYFPEITVDWDVTLNGAFSGGTDGFLLCNNRDARVIELIAPIPYQLGQPVFDGVGFTTIAMGRNGGAKITTPKAFLRRWGI
jgi:hypothetical protein